MNDQRAAAPAIPATLARLYRRNAFGIKFGLETELELLRRMGDPARGLKCIHVAGTNGKGSVCAMLDAMLRALGLKTGLYTSPHLIRFNERIRVNGACIPDAALVELIALVDTHDREAARDPAGREATFFEFATALAFEWFRRQGVEAVVLETGMGGRLDATNVVTPVVAVITGISLEHMTYLGPDLPAVAREKSGIIKPNRPVVIGPLVAAAFEVVEQTARAQHARLVPAEQTVSVNRRAQTLDGQKIHVESAAAAYGTLALPLLGAHQLANAATAVAAMEEFTAAIGLDLPPAVVKKGLAGTRWPARFQVVERDPPLIVDGAHNPEAAAILAHTLKATLKNVPIGLVSGLCADKDAAGFFKALAGPVKRCWAVPLNNERGLPPAAVAVRAAALGCPVATALLAQALEEATAWAAANRGAVCVAGSLFLAGETLARRGLTDRLFT